MIDIPSQQPQEVQLSTRICAQILSGQLHYDNYLFTTKIMESQMVSMLFPIPYISTTVYF